MTHGMPYPVRRFLDLSSGHLSAETWAWLDAQTTEAAVRGLGPDAQAVLAGRMRHGWFVYADAEPGETVPGDLAAVLRHARKLGCEYVLLDADAPPLADLPILHPDFAEAHESQGGTAKAEAQADRAGEAATCST